MTRLSALVLAAGAALAPAAHAELVTYTYWDPALNAYVDRTVDVAPEVHSPVITYSYVEPSTVVYTQPDIVVTAPRMTEDEAITAEVMDRIATNGRISGRVDVETYRNDVTLRGRVTTPGQVDRAERAARSVDGVRDVNNLLRSRVGNS
jgi:hypothetical protein